MKLNAKQIGCATGGIFLAKAFDMNLFVEKCTFSANSVDKNSMYVAVDLEGQSKQDQFNILMFAIKRGAKVILVERPVDDSLLTEAELNSCCVILVDDLIASVTNIANYWEDKVSAKNIVVYDIANKPSVRIYEIISQYFNSSSCPQNYHCRLSVPCAILDSEVQDKILLLDGIADFYEELRQVYKIVAPNICVIVDGPDLVAEQDLFNIVNNLEDHISTLIINAELYLAYKDTFLSKLSKRNIDVIVFGNSSVVESKELDTSISTVLSEIDIHNNITISTNWNFCDKQTCVDTKNQMSQETAHITLQNNNKQIIYQILAIVCIFAKLGVSLFDAIKCIKPTIIYTAEVVE